MMLVKLVAEIDLNEAYRFLQSPLAGVVNMFIGTVRNHPKGREVTKLIFEAYKSMAVKELEKVAERVMNRWLWIR